MRVRRVEDRETFARLAGAWRELTGAGGQASPFSSHEWFECCWAAAAPERAPLVLLVEDATGPVAAVPLARRRRRLRGLSVRVLGHLDAPDTPFVEWPLAAPAGAVVPVVLDHLLAHRDWDALDWGGLPAGSPVLKALAAAGGRLRWRRRGGVRSPYTDVTGGFDAFWRATTQRFKKTVRNVRNRLERAGRAAVEEHRRLDARDPLFAELLDVSARSWKGPRGLAIATMPGMRDFFAAWSAHATAHGWLRLWVLRLDGRAVATEYQVEAAGRVHALRADFDAALPEELSPGTYLTATIVRALFDAPGVHEYDMGPGDNAYKARWATGAHETVRLRAFAPGLWGSALDLIESRVVPALRRARGAGA